jgi:hypothetical protein
LYRIEPHTGVLGIFHSGRSNSAVSTVITTAVMAVIQNEMVSVGRSMVVRRSSCVPSAQTAAATSASITPTGPPRQVGELVPQQQRDAERRGAHAGPAAPAEAVENSSAPMTAEKIGIV